MTSYISFGFLGVFLPVTMLIYSIVPRRHRWKVLLLASYFFFYCFSEGLIVYILFSSLSIHHFGLWLENIGNEQEKALAGADKAERKEIKATFQNKKKRVITGAVLLHIGILLVLKYSGFFWTNINSLIAALGFSFAFEIPAYILPLGISFYTMQAVSYLFDVYRNAIKPDKNVWRLSLYLSFFPSVMEGPICRYTDTAEVLWKGEGITYRNMTFGFQRILFGVMKKMVIADRLNILIKTVFNDYANYNGTVAMVGMVCYTCQLYMEFSGTMDVVIGTGEIFGINLPENFRQPFFSTSISDFWARWHITLGTWFRDYIFYPVSMSPKMKKLTMKARKKIGNYYGPTIVSAIALFCVWFSNGVWHGAAWHYIFFGLYHFFWLLLGRLAEPGVKYITEKLHINRSCTAYRAFQLVRTIILVNIGELFFRADDMKAGFTMLGKMFTEFSIKSFYDGTLVSFGIGIHDFVIVGITVLLILFISILREKDVKIRQFISERNIVVRWAVYYALIMFIVIFGAYGGSYVPIDPIYANF